MIIGFTGTRKGMSDNQKTVFVYLLSQFNQATTILSHGDAVGADKEANDLFMGPVLLGVQVLVHPPKEEKYRAWCGIDNTHNGSYIINISKHYGVRDKDIVDECTLLLAAPLDENKEELRSGTWQTIRYARKIKKPYILLPR